MWRIEWLRRRELHVLFVLQRAGGKFEAKIMKSNQTSRLHCAFSDVYTAAEQILTPNCCPPFSLLKVESVILVKDC